MGGPTTKTTQQQQQSGTQSEQQQQAGLNTQQGSTTSTPNLPDWYSNYLQTIPGGFQSLSSQLWQMANAPLYGPTQIANYTQQLGNQYAAAGQNAQEALARAGALNSGRAGQVQTGLAAAQSADLGNFLAQIPQLNYQQQASTLGQQGNVLANAANFRIPYGQTIDTSQLQSMLSSMTGSGQSQENSSSSSTQQQSGGLFQSLLGGLLGAGMSALTGGLSGVLGGAGFGAGAAQGLGGTPVSAAPTPSYTPSYPMGPTRPFTGGYPQAPNSGVFPWESGGAGLPPTSGWQPNPYSFAIG